jgi:hypothetical protein
MLCQAWHWCQEGEVSHSSVQHHAQQSAAPFLNRGQQYVAVCAEKYRRLRADGGP